MSDEQQKLASDFLKAVNRKDFQEMERLLKAGANIDVGNVRGVTPLMASVLSGNVALAEWLIKRGANPAAQNTSGDTPLHEAAKAEDPELLNALLSAKGVGSLVNVRNHLGSTPLIEACAARRHWNAKALLKAGAGVNEKTLQGTSALLTASARHDHETVSLLLGAGANPNDADSYGVTALISAASVMPRFADAEDPYEASPKTMKALLAAKANPNVAANSGNTPLAAAATCMNRKGLMTLLDYGADPNVHSTAGVQGELSPLMVAAAKHDVEVIKRLIAAKANVNFKNNKGQGALFMAMANGAQASDPKAKAAALEAIETLLDAGAKLDSGRTTLGLATYAVLSDNQPLLEKAQSKGLINQQDENGVTALHVAVANRKKDMMIALLNLGADPNVADAKGMTPLHFIASNPQPKMVLQLIAVMKASQDEKKKAEGARLEKELQDAIYEFSSALIDKGANLEAQDKKGDTPLMQALISYAFGNVDRKFVDFLVDKGASIQTRNQNEDSPFAVSIKMGDEALALSWADQLLAKGDAEEVRLAILNCCWTAPEMASQVEAMAKVFKALMEKGAEINAQDADGQTPLIVAAATNQEELTSALLDLGADPNLKNAEGEVPAVHAIANNHPNISKILLERGANPEIRNKDGEDLMAIAYRYQRSAVVTQLVEARQRLHRAETESNDSRKMKM